MSIGLKTGRYVYQSDELQEIGNPLHSEFGWHEVAKGLTRILIGYFILVCSWIVGGAALYLAIFHKELEAGEKLSKQAIGLILFVAIGFLGLASLVSFGFVVAGKWRCALNAPERYAAKWLIFLCLLCVLMSPVLHFAFSMSGQGAENYNELKQHGRQGLAEIKLEGLSGIMQLLSTGIGLASVFFFVLFLRAAACCFNSKICLWAIHLYLVYSCVLIGVSLIALMNVQDLARRPEVLMLLAAGWLIGMAWYVLIIAGVRISIGHGMNQDYSPLSL
jgi:hypothetical protein